MKPDGKFLEVILKICGKNKKSPSLYSDREGLRLYVLHDNHLCGLDDIETMPRCDVKSLRQRFVGYVVDQLLFRNLAVARVVDIFFDDPANLAGRLSFDNVVELGGGVFQGGSSRSGGAMRSASARRRLCRDTETVNQSSLESCFPIW